MKLNYATTATCWRLGNDVIASEMTVRDSDRYVTLRSLVSATNNTNFVIEVRLKGKMVECGDLGVDDGRIESDELVESQKYLPPGEWAGDQNQVNCYSLYSLLLVKESDWQELETCALIWWNWTYLVICCW